MPAHANGFERPIGAAGDSCQDERADAIPGPEAVWVIHCAAVLASARQTLRYAHPIVRSLRVHQWVKNVFVLAAVLFSKKAFTEPATLGVAMAAFALFCIASGAVYLVNDVMDVDVDREHPVKRRRPVASGALPIGAAIRAATWLVGSSLLLAFLLDHQFALVLASYLALNLLYSKLLKQIAFVDVLSISLGFVLRVVAGALAVAVHISGWLVLCTFLLAAFLGFGKRKHELESSGHDPTASRSVLARYSPRLLDASLVGTAIATAVAYALYTVDEHTVAAFGTDRLYLSVPLIVFGIGRFWQLVRRPHAESPTEEMLRDVPFLLNIAAWGGLVVWLVSRSA